MYARAEVVEETVVCVEWAASHIAIDRGMCMGGDGFVHARGGMKAARRRRARVRAVVVCVRTAAAGGRRAARVRRWRRGKGRRAAVAACECACEVLAAAVVAAVVRARGHGVRWCGHGVWWVMWLRRGGEGLLCVAVVAAVAISCDMCGVVGCDGGADGLRRG